MRKLEALLAVFLLAAGLRCGSEEDLAARVVVRNDFQNARFTLVRVVYKEALWDSPIGRGEQSEEKRVSPGLDYAYALAVWDYDPNTQPPQVPIVIRTKNKVEAIKDAVSPIVFSEPNHFGKCGGMTKQEYESIASTYFSGIEVTPYDDIACPG